LLSAGFTPSKSSRKFICMDNPSRTRNRSRGGSCSAYTSGRDLNCSFGSGSDGGAGKKKMATGRRYNFASFSSCAYVGAPRPDSQFSMASADILFRLSLSSTYPGDIPAVLLAQRRTSGVILTAVCMSADSWGAQSQRDCGEGQGGGALQATQSLSSNFIHGLLKDPIELIGVFEVLLGSLNDPLQKRPVITFHVPDVQELANFLLAELPV